MTVPKPLAIATFAVPWVIASVCAALLFAARYPADGEFHAETAVDGKSAWIHPFLPAERASSPGMQAEGWTGQRVTDDPTYFTARTPGPYDRVDVEIEFRPIHQPLLEFGLVRDAEGKDLDLKPLYSEALERPEWRRTVSGDVEGYVRQGRSNDRLASGEVEGLAVWDATTTYPSLSDPVGPEIVTPVSLRGSHDFYVVPSGGEVRMTFVIQAANRTEGSDNVVFRVFKGDEEISRRAFGASGSRERRMGKTSEHDVVVSDAAPGVYRVSFVAGDDVFMREIRTTSRHWMVGPRLYFGDVVGYATTTQSGRALTDSRHIVAETFHVEGIQKIQFGSTALSVKKTHEPTRADRSDSGPAALIAPKGDVRIVGDGLFALRDDAYFVPRPRRWSDRTDPAADGIDAVLTSYERLETLGDGWVRAHASWTIDPSMDTLRFVLSAPGIASRAGGVDVRRIALTYHRPAQNFGDWWRTIRTELANAWRRL